MKPYWSASSMVLYVVMGLVSMGAVSYVKKREYKQNKIQKLGNKAYVAWIIILEGRTQYSMFRISKIA